MQSYISVAVSGFPCMTMYIIYHHLLVLWYYRLQANRCTDVSTTKIYQDPCDEFGKVSSCQWIGPGNGTKQPFRYEAVIKIILTHQIIPQVNIHLSIYRNSEPEVASSKLSLVNYQETMFPKDHVIFHYHTVLTFSFMPLSPVILN